MKKVVISLFAILASTSFAMAADAGCDAFKWPVTREQALFAGGARPRSPALPWQSGEAADLALVAGRYDQLYRAAGTRAGSRHVWRDGKCGRAARGGAPDQPVRRSLGRCHSGRPGHRSRWAFSGVKTCPGIRKSVRFKLAAGPATIQFSGAKKAELKVAVLTPE